MSWQPAVIFLALATALPAATLVRSGQAAAVIVLPAEPLPVERFAAAEMAMHIRLATAAELPVVFPDAIPDGFTPIRLGRAAELERTWPQLNDGRVRISADAIDLAGRDGNREPLTRSGEMGTLFAVYDFLNHDLGVRWFWPGPTGTYVPRRADLALAPADRLVTSPIRYADWRISSKNDGEWPDRSTAKTFSRHCREWLLRHRFTFAEDLHYGHAFTSYWERFHQDHPEYFNLLPNGQRLVDPLYNNPKTVSMCVTNPDFIAQVVADWRQRGQDTVLNLNENDTNGKCVCASCLAADANDDPGRLELARQRFQNGDRSWSTALGSLSERYARFYQAAMRAADHINPHHRAIGCIYANYYEPPKTVTFDHRLIMRFCPPIMFPWTREKIDLFKRLWKGWDQAGVSLMMRPNFTLDGHGFPLLYDQEYLECRTFALEHNLVAVDFDSLTGSFGANGLMLYAIASSLTLNKDKTAAAIEADFLQAFGPAAPMLAEYHRLVRTAVAAGTPAYATELTIEGGKWADFFLYAHHIYTPEVMRQAEALLRQARQAAAGDQTIIDRLELLECGLADARLVLAAQAAFTEHRTPGKITVFAEALRRLDDFRRRHAANGYADIGRLAALENRHWPRHLAAIRPTGREITGWKINFDPANTGDALGYASQPDLAGWEDIATDGPWEKQPAGLAWEKKHGRVYKGVAWYATAIVPAEGEGDRPLRLCFGAVDGSARIFLNGALLLDRPYPWQGNRDSWRQPFSVPIPAGLLKPGPNHLVVRVEKHLGVSGIWRAVFLDEQPRKWPPMTDNRILDGDFAAGRLAPPWSSATSNGSFAYAVITHPDRPDAFALQVACSAVDASTIKAYGHATQQVKVEPGVPYAFRVRFKTMPDFVGNVSARLQGSKDRNPQAILKLAALGISDEWRELTGAITPDRDLCSIAIGITGGTGTLLVDEMQLVREDAAAPPPAP